MLTQKYQTQQKRLTTKYWTDAPGMYISRVTPLDREDAAKQLKNYCWESVRYIHYPMVYCIITYLPFLICD